MLELQRRTKSLHHQQWLQIDSNVKLLVILKLHIIPVPSAVNKFTITSSLRTETVGVAIIWAHTITAEPPSVTLAMAGTVNVATE